MARNVVQFQKGLSEPAFEQQYGTEEQCRAIVIELRWPDGFECPACGGHVHSLVKPEASFSARPVAGKPRRSLERSSRRPNCPCVSGSAPCTTATVPVVWTASGEE